MPVRSAEPGLTAGDVRVRELHPSDLDEVIRIDARHTGERERAWWQRVFRDFVGTSEPGLRVGLAAESGGAMIGYLLGEVRAFEFGSEACGWVFGVGVDGDHRRAGVASALLTECCRRFREAGVRRVRTMVRRDDVPVLSFFRTNGFVAGTFVQLETDLDPQEGNTG